jgi:hypothetical protein
MVCKNVCFFMRAYVFSCAHGCQANLLPCGPYNQTMGIRATVSPILPAKAVAPSRVNAPPSIRSPQGMKLFGNQLANSLAGDLESINNVLNSLATALKTPPSISQLLLTNQAGEVTAAFGPVTFNGVQYNNFLSEIHVGDPLHTGDPSKALFNANLDGSVSIGQSGWLDVHDPWDGNAAWLGTQFETVTITGAVNNGAGLVRLTIPGHTPVSYTHLTLPTKLL